MNSNKHLGRFALTGLFLFVMQNPSNVFNNNGKIENTQFVKKIKKNNHPNKIYQLPQSNSIKYKQLNDITSQVDQKVNDNNNFHLINNLVC